MGHAPTPAARAAAILAGGGAHAQANEDPECIAPAQPGGGFDLTCRVAQEGFEPLLDEPMQVTFMPGGSGVVAIAHFATTRTDDPSAIVALSTGSLLNMVTGKFGEWGPADVRFVGAVGADFGAVGVRADSEWQTPGDLTATLEEDLRSVVFGSGGSVGSQDWMKGALLLDNAGLGPKAIRHVAFDGGGEAIAEPMGGSMDVFMADVGEMTPHLDAGETRVLAVMTDERLPEPFADIPTAKEIGHDAEHTIMRGFHVGRDVSDEDYGAWVDLFREAYGSEEFAEVLREKGLLPLDMAGEEFGHGGRPRRAPAQDGPRGRADRGTTGCCRAAGGPGSERGHEAPRPSIGDVPPARGPGLAPTGRDALRRPPGARRGVRRAPPRRATALPPEGWASRARTGCGVPPPRAVALGLRRAAEAGPRPRHRIRAPVPPPADRRASRAPRHGGRHARHADPAAG